MRCFRQSYSENQISCPETSVRKASAVLGLACLVFLIQNIPTGAVLQADPLPADAATSIIDTTAFIKNACLEFETEFRMEAQPAVWEEVIEHPYLFGRIWGQYGFLPRYRFSQNGPMLHIIDPTGIEGDLFLAGTNGPTRLYLGSGHMKNWGLPIGIEGRALFILTSTAGASYVSGRLRIYGEGTGSFADIIIRMCSPILKHYINRRLTANMRDTRVILSDIALQPEKIRTSLDEDLKPEFDRMLFAINQNSARRP